MAADPKDDERRKVRPRNRVLLSGKIVFDGGARSIDCTIRDLTATGARIKLASMDMVPSSFHLIDMKRGAAIECRVSWVKPPELGLRFLSEHSLHEETKDPLAKAMRRLWLERVAR